MARINYLTAIDFNGPTLGDRLVESGGAKTDHGSGGIIPLRAA